MPDPVRIAVIDSGVHVAHPHIDPSWLLPGFAVAKDGLLDSSDEAALDSLGHGTAVIAAIQDQSPDALCLPVRVFHDSLRTSARALLAAVDRAVEYGVDIINLSLGTVNPAHRPLFEVAAGVQVPLTTQRYSEPFIGTVTPVMVSEAVVAPLYTPPFVMLVHGPPAPVVLICH